MRIEVDGVVIAGADWRESVRQLNVSGGPIIQKITPLRAAEPRWRNRGNESYAASFEVCRVHDTIPDAEIFQWEHPGQVINVGVIMITAEYDGQKRVRGGNGVLKQVGTPRLVGKSTFTRYDIEIGQIKEPKNL